MPTHCSMAESCIRGKSCGRQWEGNTKYPPMCYAMIRARVETSVGPEGTQIRAFIQIAESHHWSEANEFVTYWECPNCKHHISWINQKPKYCAGCGSEIQWKYKGKG